MKFFSHTVLTLILLMPLQVHAAETPRKINWDDLENHDIISSRKDIQPLHLMGHPYDVGYAALYFASDESKFVTGSSLLVDGGMSASIA